jgi:hypothetical protein
MSLDHNADMYANLVTTTFKSAEDLEAATVELKAKVVPEIRKIPSIRGYFLVRVGETQVVSFGVYDSELEAKKAFEALIPYFEPIVNPRAIKRPDFGGGKIISSVISPREKS